MKRSVSFALLGLAILLLVSSSALPQQNGKVLLIIRNAEGADPAIQATMITKEAGVMKSMLLKAGYAVQVASPTGEPWGTGSNVIKPDLKLSNVNVAEYKGFVIPCMAAANNDLHPDLAAVIKAAVQQAKPLAAQTGGVTMLAKSGVLVGKKYAMSGELVAELRKGIYGGTGIVKDGKIITSGMCPGMEAGYPGMQDGTPKLMEVFIAELKQSK